MEVACPERLAAVKIEGHARLANDDGNFSDRPVASLDNVAKLKGIASTVEEAEVSVRASASSSGKSELTSSSIRDGQSRALAAKTFPVMQCRALARPAVLYFVKTRARLTRDNPWTLALIVPRALLNSA